MLILIRDDASNYGSDVAVTEAALAEVRYKFNPSGLPTVDRLKIVAAAFLAVCDEVAVANPVAGRELALAKTNMQQASMWAVSGATKGL